MKEQTYPIHENRDSEKVIRFAKRSEFCQSFINSLDNGWVWGIWVNENGGVQATDNSGMDWDEEKVLLDGSDEQNFEFAENF